MQEKVNILHFKVKKNSNVFNLFTLALAFDILLRQNYGTFSINISIGTKFVHITMLRTISKGFKSSLFSKNLH